MANDGGQLTAERAPLVSEATTAPMPGIPQALASEHALCHHCGATLAGDQRYCLECGARRGEARSRFLDGLSAPSFATAGPPATGGAFNGPAGHGRAGWEFGESKGWTTLIAGVGVLLLAMGVGVLIGRSGSAGTVASGPAEVVSVGAAGAASTTGTSTPEATGTGPAATTTTNGATPATGADGSKAAGNGSSSSKATPKSSAKPAVTPAPASSPNSGASNEQKSRDLPDVVSTG